VPAHQSVDDYIASFTDESVRTVLTEIRSRIKAAHPETSDTISYAIAAVTIAGKSVLYYAGWKKHVGMYPIPAFDEALEARVAPYRASKDTIRFMFAKPIPYDLIDEIVAAAIAHRTQDH
jgi:uncharacterized protein YdhG (YjbR/CyaY superfamily)